MDRIDIDTLIKKAGLEEVISVFHSAIEINTYLVVRDLPLPNEDHGYRVLARLIETAFNVLPESKDKNYPIRNHHRGICFPINSDTECPNCKTVYGMHENLIATVDVVLKRLEETDNEIAKRVSKEYNIEITDWCIKGRLAEDFPTWADWLEGRE